MQSGILNIQIKYLDSIIEKEINWQNYYKKLNKIFYKLPVYDNKNFTIFIFLLFKQIKEMIY